MQPYIMCIRDQQRNIFFVQGDGWFFRIPNQATSITAFDLLFKLYQVLHVSYPPSLLNILIYNLSLNIIFLTSFQSAL
ncbi:hypothetical protein X777_12874 [Ooceraea biroi]|uniref:Uncharacterized protein n=1 Tax=Ooceraea biroi TaxID=2015173 RepID=A0A026VZ31_OOCBI|nr:hypothetical protein X777_12874 [Ooceraea biroi]